MSGNCNDCGNTICVCSELKEDSVTKAFNELARLKDEMKEARLLIDGLIHYIESYDSEHGAYSESIRDAIIAKRWLERNNKCQ